MPMCLHDAFSVRCCVCALVFAAAVSGCGRDEDRVAATVTTSDGTTLDSGDCDGRATAPFTVTELLEGMRAAGYDMHVDPRCSDNSASWALSNTSIHVPELGPEDFELAQAREGAISCSIFDRIEGQQEKVVVTRFEGEDFTTLITYNVSCKINPDAAKADEQVERLKDTLSDLAAAQG